MDWTETISTDGTYEVSNRDLTDCTIRSSN